MLRYKKPEGSEITRLHGTSLDTISLPPSSLPKSTIFTTQAQFLFRIGEYGYHPGQLMRPMDVAETINGNYLVSDFELHCVTVYSPTGSYISRFGQRYLSGPKGIIADRNGRILVVDQKSCMLCIFKPTGKFINRFGARGSGDNQFTNPFSVAVNSQDEIYVSDYAQHAIKVFDQNGLYLFRFGEHGIEPGMLHAPTGLAFDKQDNLFHPTFLSQNKLAPWTMNN
ncbi:NHL repeat protein [Opisthorchis viverrini]|uniref:NHL repeat protein n=1 Tax=Opisthorchis viverrini TaxID=6198 RepID=A0A1S8XAE2_OPIVI|nr:NHL repeat protein [Opisthorchis viverrini]